MQKRGRERVKEELVKFFHSREWKTPLDVYGIGQEFGESNPDMTKEFWSEEFRVILERHIESTLKPPKPQPFQMFLPGFRGDLDEPIPVDDGSLALGRATVKELRQNMKAFKAEMRAKSKAELDRMVAERQQLIDEMSPYAAIQHGITVAEYVELRAAGVTVEEFAKKNAKAKKAGGKTK